MSCELSLARRTGPFVQTVASATWVSLIDGFCCDESCSSISGSGSCRSSLASRFSAYERIASVTSTPRPLTRSCTSQIYRTTRAKVTTSTRRAPAGDERTNGVVVLDRRAGGRKGDPPSGALAAAAHRPRRRSPTALAKRRNDARQPLEAGLTELDSEGATHDTPLREEQFEHHPNLGRARSRLRQQRVPFVKLRPRGSAACEGDRPNRTCPGARPGDTARRDKTLQARRFFA